MNGQEQWSKTFTRLVEVVTAIAGLALGFWLLWH